MARSENSQAALAAYEDAMFARSKAAAVEAHRILALCLDERAPFGLIEFFTIAMMGNGDGNGGRFGPEHDWQLEA